MIYIIIPTYNERENIERLIREIFKQSIGGLRVLVVDDNSPDETGKIVENLGKELPVEVLRRAGKLGLGSAYRDGFKYCLEKGVEFVFEMDADFSHDPNDISKLLTAVQNGADLAIGSRKIQGGKILGWNWQRKLYSNGAMWFARILLHLKTKDITAGFRCFRAEALRKIKYETIKSNGYAFQVETVYLLERAGLKIAEVPVVFPDRKLGKSKLNKKDIIEFFGRVIELFLREK
jgi:dolichol-phosphate mannosyltransferase